MFDSLCNWQSGSPCKGHTWPTGPWFRRNELMDVLLRNEYTSILTSRNYIPLSHRGPISFDIVICFFVYVVLRFPF